jgi:hypothetical protein
MKVTIDSIENHLSDSKYISLEDFKKALEKIE